MAAVALLVCTVIVIVGAHRWVRASVAVAVAVAVGLLTGIVDLDRSADAVRDLAAPLAFLVAAVPLAVLLAHVGFFDAVAARITAARNLPLLLWVFAALVTTVCNLDASIVLLTPLYLRIAERRGLDPLRTAFQPVLLASLASSALPVSNLTNLIVVERLDLRAVDVVVHLGPVSLAATVVGWFAYRRLGPSALPVPSTPPAAPVRAPAGDRAGTPPHASGAQAWRVGVPAVATLLVGFTLGDTLGIPAWVVASVVAAALVAVTRELPWRSVPVDAVVVAVGLAALAAAAAPHLPLDDVLGGHGRIADLRAMGAGVVGANAVNNLPALLVGLPHVHGSTAWAFLAGVNIGPVLWISGSLAGLLWADIVRQAGHHVSPLDYARVGVRVGVPALVVAAATVLLVGAIT